MEIRLPIYEGKTVVKTYTAETYDIMFGTVEDLINALDFDKMSSGKDEDLIAAIAVAIPKIFRFIKPLLKDIFEGLTDEELKHCKVKDIAIALLNVIKFTIRQISEGDNAKN